MTTCKTDVPLPVPWKTLEFFHILSMYAGVFIWLSLYISEGSCRLAWFVSAGVLSCVRINNWPDPSFHPLLLVAPGIDMVYTCCHVLHHLLPHPTTAPQNELPPGWNCIECHPESLHNLENTNTPHPIEPVTVLSFLNLNTFVCNSQLFQLSANLIMRDLLDWYLRS